MTTLLTLIRHGQSVWNLAGRAQGLAPVPLNEKGHAQAQRLADALAAENAAIDALYSSDLSRCQQTAAPISARFGLPVRLEPRFREIDLGYWQGMSGREWREYDPDNYADYMADPINVPFPGGESRVMLAERVLPPLMDILARHAGGHVLIVTHGGPIRTILRHYGLFDYRPFSKEEPPVRNTSRTVLRVHGPAEVEPVLLYDIAHLPPELAD